MGEPYPASFLEAPMCKFKITELGCVRNPLKMCENIFTLNSRDYFFNFE